MPCLDVFVNITLTFINKWKMFNVWLCSLLNTCTCVSKVGVFWVHPIKHLYMFDIHSNVQIV